MKKSYIVNGYVVGKTWGGTIGGYPSKDYKGDSLPELKAQIKADFESGALDKGFGFEYLLSARLRVMETSVMDIDGDAWTHTERKRDIILGEKKWVKTLDDTVCW